MSLKDFEIGKELGKGAFGSVCIAKRKEDGKKYAIKRVKISSLSQREGEYALNEIRILASLSHPNIIGYNEAFFDELTKTLNIVMEFADDGDISSKITQNARSRLVFQENTIWLYLIQILEGLKYLHDNKIMHRDLKSANIFLMKNGQLKLGDLNVSKLAKMGMAQTQTGTPYYCSPEIWLDKPYNYKSDIWSVGCIVYELATLKPPFHGTSLKELSRNINKGSYDPIPSIYSRDLSKIIAKMLVVDPNFRMSTDQLLKDEIILKKIEEYKNSINLKGNKEFKAEMIKTIKLPKNLKEINRALPKKRYCNKELENEMMENDEYESKKDGLNVNNKENNDNNLKEQLLLLPPSSQAKNIPKAKENEKIHHKEHSNNIINPGYKPIIKENKERPATGQSNRPSSNNYIEDFLQKDKGNQSKDKNKEMYYYRHCINPFGYAKQNNEPFPNNKPQLIHNNDKQKPASDRPLTTSPNQPSLKEHQEPIHYIQKENPQLNPNNIRRSPSVNQRPKSSQSKPNRLNNEAISQKSPIVKKNNPPSASKPIVVKPQIIEQKYKNIYEKLDYNNNGKRNDKGSSPSLNPRIPSKQSNEKNQNLINQNKNQVIHFR